MIDSAELKLYRSTTVSDASSNGGKASATEVQDGALGNLFAPTSQAERTDGSEKYRKCFWRVENDDDLTLYFAEVFLDEITPGDDIHAFFPGTPTDTQAEIDEGASGFRFYGAGTLDVNVSASATQVKVLVEDPSIVLFYNGDKIRICDKDGLDGSGNEEDAVISGVPTIGSDGVVTIDLVDPLQNSYTTANTRVASVYEYGDVTVTFEDFLVTSAGSGDYDDTFLLGDNIGSIEETWTLTFTSATSYTIVGAEVGSVGTGNVSGGAQPNNPSKSKPYFNLQSGGFSGVWASADTIVFKTHAAEIPIWMKKIVPAGAGTEPNNSSFLAVRGQSA